jgi:hypothetical protein
VSGQGTNTVDVHLMYTYWGDQCTATVAVLPLRSAMICVNGWLAPQSAPTRQIASRGWLTG